MSQPVLICRPGERGEALAETLRAEGAWVETLDVMTLEALPDDAAMRRVWLDLDHYHRIVVVSPFAAYCLSEALDRYWPQLPVGLRFYCVGQGSAGILFEQLGIRARVPDRSAGEDTSEALLKLGSLQALAHERVLLVAGEGGRPLLNEVLSDRGARVTRIAVYRRGYRPPSPELQSRLAAGNFHTLIVTSGELLEYLAKWCHQAALNQPLIVSSHRLAVLAAQLGFCNLKVASGASPTALAAALNDACRPPGVDVD